MGGQIYTEWLASKVAIFDESKQAYILPLLMFIPAGVVAAELKDKKVSIFLTLFGLLIVAVPVVGIFNFDGVNLVTIGKALIFVPMIAGLIYFGYKRLFGK